MNFHQPFSRLFDLILPPRCLACHVIVDRARSLCSDCWSQAPFITAPYCQCCGLPFEIDVPDGALCLHCVRKRPIFVQARSVFPYDDFSRALILAFKHGDRLDLMPLLANWMTQAARPLLVQSDMVMPVPLHWRRLIKRRFNQSAVLAQEIARQNNLVYDPFTLQRIRHTPPQGHLSRMARQRNLQGAFRLNTPLSGQRVLLVDDVLTTGATVQYCTQTLIKGGASEVRVISIARVVQNQS